jgi:sigma-B regulation protein RsbU (phosphoserine phosphatase)
MAVGDSVIREQLLFRRERLQAAMPAAPTQARLAQLLEEVDTALTRLDDGMFGLCATCHDPIEPDRLAADPLVQYCLDHLTPDQRRALQMDLDLASHIQRGFLPERSVNTAGWEVHYHYEPAHAVSGDYCDVLRAGPDGLFFLVGDVSGKGVSASILMAQLHAIFRSLTSDHLPVDELVARANRIFCESTLAAYYATLVCGRVDRSGRLELCNAGHCPPLLVRGSEVTKIEATGLPVGLFCGGYYSAKSLQLSAGDMLFLYTDGLSEARNHADSEYGEDRLAELLRARPGLSPHEVTSECLKDLAKHLGAAPKTDDLTIMALRHCGKA